MRTNTFPIVAAKSACVNAHIHIPCCIDVWLHLQRSSAKGVLLAAMRTLIYEEKGRSRVSPGGYGGGKNPFGSCFLLHECMCREFVLSVFRAESLQPAMRMVWSHICLAERALGFSWNPSFSSCSSHFRKNMICCENENNDAVAHRAVVINWGERKAALCGSIIWIRWWWHGFSLADFSAALS